LLLILILILLLLLLTNLLSILVVLNYQWFTLEGHDYFVLRLSKWISRQIIWHGLNTANTLASLLQISRVLVLDLLVLVFVVGRWRGFWLKPDLLRILLSAISSDSELILWWWSLRLIFQKFARVPTTNHELVRLFLYWGRNLRLSLLMLANCVGYWSSCLWKLIWRFETDFISTYPCLCGWVLSPACCILHIGFLHKWVTP